ncbi:MAG TPA: hypothetical protein VEY08_11430 [Chloroflexia bacterium]|nr:hypothetical protein [Chloroflexia bacterium]
MTGQRQEETPQSPEVQPEYVREELDQELVTHVGEYRQPEAGGPTGGGMHLGAVDTEVVPIVPPMSGPADLIGERNQNAQGNEDGTTEIGEELIDPRDEITPG